MVEDENIKLCQKLAELERNVSELENIKITLESQLEEATKCWKCSQ